jgi:hypothetical protein
MYVGREGGLLMKCFTLSHFKFHLRGGLKDILFRKEENTKVHTGFDKL